MEPELNVNINRTCQELQHLRCHGHSANQQQLQGRDVEDGLPGRDADIVINVPDISASELGALIRSGEQEFPAK